jgi:phosphatidate cytidylyltransferase
MDPVLKTRSITAVIFATLVITLLCSGFWGLACLLAIVMMGSAYEYMKMGNYKNALTLGIIITSLFFLLALKLQIPQNIKQILLYTTVIIHTFFLASLYYKSSIPHTKFIPIIAVIYPCLALILPLMFNQQLSLPSYFWLFILFLIWMSDSGAYLFGRKLGKTKLFERISPKKTWEGFLGAGFMTLIVGMAIYYFSHTFSLCYWVIIAVFTWVLGTYGDLYESSIKRYFGVKDSGTIMPGHGGFLDRFDSFIFVIPYILFITLIYSQLT